MTTFKRSSHVLKPHPKSTPFYIFSQRITPFLMREAGYLHSGLNVPYSFRINPTVFHLYSCLLNSLMLRQEFGFYFARTQDSGNNPITESRRWALWEVPKSLGLISWKAVSPGRLATDTPQSGPVALWFFAHLVIFLHEHCHPSLLSDTRPVGPPAHGTLTSKTKTQNKVLSFISCWYQVFYYNNKNVYQHTLLLTITQDFKIFFMFIYFNFEL